MADKKIWTKDEILEMWSQARSELQGFQRHLERNAGITASQLGMALQLADIEFDRLKGSPNPYQGLADKVCPELKANFITFVNSGGGTNEYLGHLDRCSRCQEAVGEAFKRQGTAFEGFVRYLRSKSSKK